MIYDELHKVSIKIERNEQGHLVIQIKGPEENPTLTYNDAAALIVSSTSGEVSIPTLWYGTCGVGAAGGGLSYGDAVGSANSGYGGECSAPQFTPPEGVDTMIVASGGMQIPFKKS